MSSPRRCRIGLALILAGSGLLFAPSLRFPFLWDDTAVVRDNPYLHSPTPAGLFFQPHFWQQLLPVSRFDYRPLQMLTLSAISRIGGRDPFPYRTANLALHLLVSLLVFFASRRLGAGKNAALLAAAFFAFHPIHVETVVCARNISELMTAGLLLAALIIFLRPEKQLRWLALILFAAALLYKESALIFPLLLTVLVISPYRKKGAGKTGPAATIPFWVLAAVGGAAKIFLSSGPPLSRSLPFYHLPAGVGRLLITNLRLLAFPARLRVLYHFPVPETWAEPAWFLSLAGLVLLAGILIAGRRDRLVFPLLLALGVGLLPALSRVGQDGRTVAEQRLYLPSFFFCLAAAVLVERVRTGGGERRRRAVGLTAGALCVFLAALTGNYLRAWRDELPLWRWVTAREPRAAIAFNNLAIALSRAGDSEGARENLRRALQADPHLPEAHTNLGIFRAREGRWEQAAGSFRAARAAEPSHHPASLYLGQAYLRLGRVEEAAGVLEQILEENPRHFEAANELAIALERLGRREEAAALYRAAAGLNPEYAAPLRNLAELYRETGEFERALEAGREAVAKRPDQPRGYVILANIHIARGQWREAKEVLTAGARRHPEDWGIRSRLLALEAAPPEQE